MIDVSAGPVLRRYRDERGYTQEALAAALGVSWSSVAQWESGKITPRRNTAQRIDDQLGANGEILAAFGYLSQQPADDRLDALRSEVAQLVAMTTALAEQVAEQGAEVVRLRGELARRLPPEQGVQQ